MSWVGVTIKDGINSLNHTDRTDDSEMNLHEVELGRGVDSEEPVAIGDVGAPARFRYIKNRKYMRRLYLVLAALAAIFIFSSLLRLAIKSNEDGSKSPSTSSSSSKKDIDLTGTTKREGHLLILMHDITKDELEIDDLINATSPQRRALNWIANEDTTQIEIPETRFDETYPAFLQRYSAAVLAFAWGPDVLAPLGFLSADNECQWNAKYERPDKSVLDMGLICSDDEKQVEKIVLQTVGLSGSIPREIGNFHALSHLHLDKNELTGSLPHRLDRLHELRELTATRNSLGGHLPPFIAHMSSLRHLELSKNEFEGHLEYPFGGIVTSPLVVLALDNNKFNGPVGSLHTLHKLEELYLNDNFFSHHVSNNLENHTKLAIVDMSSNNMGGKVPDVSCFFLSSFVSKRWIVLFFPESSLT